MALVAQSPRPVSSGVAANERHLGRSRSRESARHHRPAPAVGQGWVPSARAKCQTPACHTVLCLGHSPFYTAEPVGDRPLHGVSESVSKLSAQTREPTGPRRRELPGPGGQFQVVTGANCSCPLLLPRWSPQWAGLPFLTMRTQAVGTQARRHLCSGSRWGRTQTARCLDPLRRRWRRAVLGGPPPPPPPPRLIVIPATPLGGSVASPPHPRHTVPKH